MSVAQYMALALGHPEHGYYMTRDPFGRGGDFTTAPEISQMFGEMIGAWTLDTWQRMGAPPVAVVELGPGRGTLMADLMRVATRLSPDFAAAVTMHLVETSPGLRAIQAGRLAAYAPVWHGDLSTLPDGPSILVANEFFDALPIRQFVATERGLAEQCIGPDPGTGELAFMVERHAAPFSGSYTPAPKEGMIVETCPQAIAIARYLARRIAAQGGAALILDYGYTEPQGDTFQAVRDHRYANVLHDPGDADLTAHVDFAALSHAAREEGAVVSGPIGQGEFLLSLGMAHRAERLGTPEARAALARLTGPDRMGTLFKVLLLSQAGAAS